MNKIRIVACLTIALAISLTGKSQEATITTLTETVNEHLEKKDASDVVKKALGNPELINSVLGLVLDGNNNNFKIKFKTFEEEGQNAALGLDYSLNIGKSTFNKAKNEVDRWGFSGALKATGNIAFDSKANPADFLRSEFDLGTFISVGGVAKPKGGATSADFLNFVDSILVEIEDQDELKEFLAGPLWLKTFDEMALSNQYYLEFALAGGLESDQRFDKQQWTFGAVSNLGLKAWNKSNVAARLNVFDWPFAFIRAITGTEKDIRPRGSSLPTFIVGLDLVNPVVDSVRETLTSNLDKFWRIRFETGYRSLVTELKGTQIFFNASYRYFKEFNAPAEVIAAEKDMYQYFVASLTSSQGFFISYSVGDLPFDRRDDAFYEIGFKYQFKD